MALVDISGLQFGCWLQRPDQCAVWQKRGLNLSVISTPQPSTLSDLQYGQAMAALKMPFLKLPNFTNPSADFTIPFLAGYAYSDEPEDWNHLSKDPNGNLDASINVTTDIAVINSLHAVWKAAGLTLVDYRNFNGPTLSSMSGWNRDANHPVIIADYQGWLPLQSIISADAYPIATGSGGLVQLAQVQDKLVTWGKAGQRRFGYVECGTWSGATTLISPDQLRAEFWLNIIKGCTGIMFFQTPYIPVGTIDPLVGTPLEAEIINAIALAKQYANFFLRGSLVYSLSGSPVNGTYSGTWSMPDGSALTITQSLTAPYTTIFSPSNNALAVALAKIAKQQSAMQAAIAALQAGLS